MEMQTYQEGWITQETEWIVPEDKWKETKDDVANAADWPVRRLYCRHAQPHRPSAACSNPGMSAAGRARGPVSGVYVASSPRIRRHSLTWVRAGRELADGGRK